MKIYFAKHPLREGNIRQPTDHDVEKEKDEEKKPGKTVKAPTAEAAVKPKAAAKPVKKKEEAAKVITTDDIALRAYFIAERRQAAGGHGDEDGDWVEAERQLCAEAGKK